jgi:hypothetical protein
MKNAILEQIKANYRPMFAKILMQAKEEAIQESLMKDASRCTTGT